MTEKELLDLHNKKQCAMAECLFQSGNKAHVLSIEAMN